MRMSATGESRTVVTFVRVDSATSLPLGDDVTARNDDTVFTGLTSRAAWEVLRPRFRRHSVALSRSAIPQADTIQILDDGAANTGQCDWHWTQAMTATGLQDQTPEPCRFLSMPGTGTGDLYSGSVDGARQQTGISARLIVNPALLNDPSLLVKYSSSAGSADQTRPNALNDALTNMDLQFTYQDGGAPVTMTVDELRARSSPIRVNRPRLRKRERRASRLS